MFRLKVRSPPDNIEKVTVLNLEKTLLAVCERAKTDVKKYIQTNKPTSDKIHSSLFRITGKSYKRQNMSSS